MSRAWYGILLALVLVGALGAPARAGGGVYGGYVGSDSSMNTDIENMGRRALSEDALQSHNGYPGQGAIGPDVTLHIMFPSQQTGLSNIEMVMLVPERPGAHNCQALAQEKSRTELYSLFIPKKDIRAGMLYDVVVSDAMGDQFIVGRINVSGASAQDFIINAPQLMPGSPHYNGPASARGFAIAYPGGRSAGPNWQRGGEQRPVPAHGRARLRAKQEFKREAALQPWVMGMKVLTLTHYMMAVAGYSDVHLRGVIVYAVIPGGPAEAAGIRKGDFIAEVGGQRCVNAAQFVQYARAMRGPLDLVMYSQLHHGVVRMRVMRDVRRGPQEGFGTADRWRDPRALKEWPDRRGYEGRPQAGSNYVPPPTSAYAPPRVGPGYVPPTIGQGFVPPGSSSYRPPVAGPGYVPPGSSSYHPPVVGPGYVPPGQAATLQRTVAPSTKGKSHPAAQGSSSFHPLVTGPGYVPRGQAATSQRTATPSKKKKSPSPTQGSSAFKPPTTGPGYQPPGH